VTESVLTKKKRHFLDTHTKTVWVAAVTVT